MKAILGRKQSQNDPALWTSVFQNIETYITKEEVDRRIDQTLCEMRAVVGSNSGLAYAWSGGKDSIVLSFICRMMDICPCMWGACNLEFPAFVKWVQKHRPPELEIVNTGQDLPWLLKHPDMLFPQDTLTADTWFQFIQWTAQAQYYKKHGLRMLLFGRRRLDGNVTGKEGIRTRKDGLVYYSPLYLWKHEEIMGALHYYNLALPPNYSWPRGWRVATGPWPKRRAPTKQQAWEETFIIDPDLVIRMAPLFPSGQTFLDRTVMHL